MSFLKKAIYGSESFNEKEELFEFKYHFMSILILFGIISSTLFIFANHTKANILPVNDLRAIQMHLISAVISLLILRSKKELFYWVCWIYGIICLFVFTAALIWVPTDELRILWFFLNIPAYYLMLGKFTGVLVTIVSAIIIIIANQYSVAPYSSNAIATGFAGLVFISAFFYFYSERSLSFFTRMLDANEKLRYMATHDSLTGVLNARTFYEISNKLITIAQRELSAFSILFVDLDHFKKINDTYGHEAGDLVLKEVTQEIQRISRESDIIGRVGGEEFTLFFTEHEYRWRKNYC